MPIAAFAVMMLVMLVSLLLFNNCRCASIQSSIQANQRISVPQCQQQIVFASWPFSSAPNGMFTCCYHQAEHCKRKSCNDQTVKKRTRSRQTTGHSARSMRTLTLLMWLLCVAVQATAIEAAD
jgi:hypothetical protein